MITGVNMYTYIIYMHFMTWCYIYLSLSLSLYTYIYIYIDMSPVPRGDRRRRREGEHSEAHQVPSLVNIERTRWAREWEHREGTQSETSSSSGCAFLATLLAAKGLAPPGVANRTVCPSASLEEWIISLLAPCSGSLPWNPLTVAISACLRG